MIDPIRERCALGDATYELLHRVRHLQQIVPDADRLRCGQPYQDADGKWWVIGVEAAYSETEAEILSNRLNDQ